MADDNSMGERQHVYEKREAVWSRAKSLLSDRVFEDGTSRTQAELGLALFLVGE
jgi:hypothetical protein